MRVLVFTNMYPYEEMPYYGSFVHDEVKALRNAGCDVDVLFINGRKNKLSYFASPWRLMAAIGNKDYDIVHVHHSFCGLVASWQRRVPTVWTFHEGEITGGEEDIGRDGASKRLAHSKSFKRHVARRVDRVIVVADYLKEPLGRADADTIPSGLDMSLFSPMDRAAARGELEWDNDVAYALFPSSPERVEKRFDLADAAVEILKQGGRKIELAYLQDVPHEKVPVYMNAADVLLMTSSFEASPVAVREALACNLPVVSTDVGDVRSLLEKIDGCHVASDRPEDLADAVASVLDRGGRIDGRRIVQGFSLDRTSRRILDVYNGLISKKA